MDNHKIRVSHLSVEYRKVQALRDISLEVLPGRLTGLIGPNGAGKSTLIKGILGLIPSTQGEVTYKNQPLKQQLSKVAYVPQRSQIDWTYPVTVWDVVMMGRVKQTGWLRGFSTSSKNKAKEALMRVGMSAYADRPIGQLSGGQQQRVFLARSLTQGGEIFLFDEPFVGVDHRTQEIIFGIFQELAQEGKIILVVNHDLGESITNFDDLILLDTEVIAYGDRQSVLQAENLERAYSGRVRFFNLEEDYDDRRTQYR